MNRQIPRVRTLRPGRLSLVGLLMAAVMLALGLAGCGGPTSAANPVAVATVNGHPISMSDYQEMLAFYKVASSGQAGTLDWQLPAGRDNLSGVEAGALDRLINLELMRQALAQYHGQVSPAALTAARKQLDASIAQALKSGDPATVAQIHALSDRDRFLFAEQQATQDALIKVLKLPTVHLRAIVVGSQAQGQQVLQQVEQGADFGKIANQLDPNQTSGGEQGTVWPAQLPAAFDAALFGAHHPKYSLVPYSNQWVVLEVTGDNVQPLTAVGDPQQEVSILTGWLSRDYRAHATIDRLIYIPASSQPTQPSTNG